MSIIKHVTLQKIVAHDFRYGPRNIRGERQTGTEMPAFNSVQEGTNWLGITNVSLIRLSHFDTYMVFQKSVIVTEVLTR